MVNLLIKKYILVAVTALLLAPVTTVFSAPFSDFSGNQKTIADYRSDGKWLVVMLWASDCHVCNQEAHQYVKFHKKHADKDARMLGISLDGKQKFNDAKSFVKRHKLNFPNLIGEPENVAGTYAELTGGEWLGTPTFMVYNPKGELLGAQVGAVPTEVIEGFIARESSNSKP